MIVIGKRRKRRIIPLFTLLLILIMAGSAARLLLFWNSPAQEPGREVLVSIPAGASFVDAAEKLLESGVISSLEPFVLLGKVRRLSGTIQAGEFLLRTDMTPVQVLDVLATGRPVSYSVTLPEGLNFRQIVDVLTGMGLGRRDRFLALGEDEDFARSLGLPAGRLEGFLFPDTYSWPKGLSEEEILGRMASRYREVFNRDMARRAVEMGLTELEVVTLASIVEKETGDPEERGLVAAVFHNRLAKGYRLQTDPTVIYGMKDFDGNLTKEDLLRDHPYNTYTRGGLPPGPIASPGEASLNAALYPADIPYLYFVARGDGGHVFSNTLVEHNRAVEIHQLGQKP